MWTDRTEKNNDHDDNAIDLTILDDDTFINLMQSEVDRAAYHNNTTEPKGSVVRSPSMFGVNESIATDDDYWKTTDTFAEYAKRDSMHRREQQQQQQQQNDETLEKARSFSKKGKIAKTMFLLFRHPITRNVVALLALIFNWIVYTEDPISYSEKEAKVYGLGRVWNYAFRQYPPVDEFHWTLLKLGSFIVWITFGALIGKYLIHDALLRDALGLKLFRKDMGSWTCMSLTICWSLFLGSFAYNGIVKSRFHLQDGSDNEGYVLSDYVGMTEFKVGVVAVVLTILCDCLNIFVINDSMAQDACNSIKRKIKYGLSGPICNRIVHFWKARRLHIFYIYGAFTIVWILLILFFIKASASGLLSTSAKGHYDWTQYGRILACSFLLLYSMLMFIQDWDFPKFKRGGKNIVIAGCETNPSYKSERCCKIKFRFNGKWLHFGTLLFVILLDGNLLLNQVFYDPIDYNQIADSNGHVRNVFNELVVNETYLHSFFGRGVTEAFSFSPSNNNGGDYNDTQIEKTTRFVRPLVGPKSFFTNATDSKGRSYAVACFVVTNSETFQNATDENDKNGERIYYWPYNSTNYECYNVSDPFNILYVESNAPDIVGCLFPLFFAILFGLINVVYFQCHNATCCMKKHKCHLPQALNFGYDVFSFSREKASQ